ncbi:MAG: outer membrane lipoprotein carrier protein LolA [Candidatus Latescibacterota bacterium]|nr:MAG: outer membrane lipoprotein carrier protein LolA [Candidatus Latescibacterota bacterium]
MRWRVRQVRRAIALGMGLLWAGLAFGLTGQEVLSRLQKRYKKLRSFSAEFRYTFCWKLVGEARQQEGKVFFRKPNLFRIETPDRVVVCDGKTVWNYTPATRQVVVTDYGDRSLSPTLQDIIADYLESYTPHYARPDTVSGERCHLLRLVPKDPEERLEVRLWVEEKRWMVRKLSYSDEVGNETTYLLKDVQVNPKLDKKLFRFKVPEGAEVVDLRPKRP